MELERNEKSPVNIKILFRNITLSGYSQAKLVKATGFKKNPQGNKLDLVINMKKLILYGPYVIDGQILILPIQGKGNCNITMGKIFTQHIHTF